MTAFRSFVLFIFLIIASMYIGGDCGFFSGIKNKLSKKVKVTKRGKKVRKRCCNSK